MADVEDSGSEGHELAPKDPQYPHKPVYCPNCSLPPDYCKYSENFNKCKPWLLKNYPNLYPELAADAEVAVVTKAVDGALIIDDNVEGAAASAEPSSSGKKGKKKEDEGPAEIVISTVARTKKKNVTHITGLARFGIKLVDAQKIFAKKFAAAASVTQDKDEVVIQGDCAITLSELLIKQWPEKINSSVVFIIEDGERRNMDD